MIQFRHGSRRNTKCYGVAIGNYNFGISYETVVSAHGPKHGRLSNTWGPTTAKHICDLGARDLPVITTEEMEKIYESAILDEAERILGTRHFRDSD